MIKNNNRNSRDDKSKPGNRSTTGRRPSGTDSSYKGKSKFDDKEGKDNKFGGSRDFKPREGDRKDFKPREGDRKDFKPRGSSDGDARSFKPRSGGDFKPREGDRKDFKPRGSSDGDARSFKPRTGGDFKPREGDRKDFKPRGSSDGDARSFKPRSGGDFKPREGDRKDFKPRGSSDGDARSFKPRSGGDFKPRDGEKRDFKPRAFKEGSSRETPPGEKTRSYIKKDNFSTGGDKPFRKFDDTKSSSSRSTDSRPFRKRDSDSKSDFQDRGERVENGPTMRSRKNAPVKDDGLIRLNRYIANSGICSRRKADELIAAGVVSVNGEVVSELGQKVDPGKDEIRYNGELLKREKRVYVLLNKPKDYITTTDDPQERRTVMQLVEKASRERIYPVGRLDRNTTGLLLMTNDGDLADKLSHPKNGITKIYHVELNRSLSQGDFNKIEFGLELEDGLIKPDNISYVAGGTKREVGIQIHSGKNRIVRRIFEHLGYDVVKLDRVVYGNLTKKDLPRGRWRFLEEHELIQIKHLIK
ncbi:pseudouridine synthase [Pedobacter metabolipauper]|uniref:Pseudouridine synthase n=1 Tax=Pedobacter metabolipauper TaxID=425513 RepID=A0A4R6SRN2_9SPHI|nr:pseudouridine synthase [Pedobacter metabolipauper]TDQ07670.1 23S rRNA pseudouridine2605 synthase [Pedobacter metabolipauper]